MWTIGKTIASNSKTKFASLMTLTVLAGLLSANPISARDADETRIKVHGDWVVTVMNSDGSVAKEVFFQNSLVSWGPTILTRLLIGDYSIGKRADDSPAWNIGFGGLNILNDCFVLNRPDPIEYSPNNATVSQTDNKHFTLTTSLSLPASCIDGASYDINRVFTEFQSDKVFPPFVGIFSATTITAITGIQADQFVTFKVTFSFE